MYSAIVHTSIPSILHLVSFGSTFCVWLTIISTGYRHKALPCARHRRTLGSAPPMLAPTSTTLVPYTPAVLVTTWNASWFHCNVDWSLEDRGYENVHVNTGKGNQDIFKHNCFFLSCLIIDAWLSTLNSMPQVHNRELVGFLPSWAH
jgi:hypothetical protein